MKSWPAVAAIAAIVAGLVLLSLAAARGHDSWISRGGHRNGVGEWCCGEGDCFVLTAAQVAARADGYHVWLDQVVDGRERRAFEVVPYREAQPSPDGAFWRCKRPDGSRRCFFAPPPNT